MNVLTTHRTLHPMQWVALIAVTLFAVTGIGAITGLIPVAKSQTEPQTAPLPVATAAEKPVSEPAMSVAAAKESKEAKPVARQHHTIVARNDPPPPAGAVPPDFKPQVASAQSPAPAPAFCADCGEVESVQRIVKEGDGSGIGAVAGGVVGGALGNGIGQGNGRKLTTLAGLIGGALLGNHIEKSNKQTVSYQTTVRFEDGTTRVFNQSIDQGFKQGERVRLDNGVLQPAS